MGFGTRDSDSTNSKMSTEDGGGDDGDEYAAELLTIIRSDDACEATLLRCY